MKLHLIGAIICLTVAYCWASPITTIMAGHQGPRSELRPQKNLKELAFETKGMKEEETQGVFKKDELNKKIVPESDSESEKITDKSEKSDIADKKEEESATNLSENKEEIKVMKKAVSPKKSHHKTKVTGRQSSDDDDDDDDDEEDDDDDDVDLGLGLGGDGSEDDDDDEDDEDDEGETSNAVSEDNSENVRDEEDDNDDDDEGGDYDDFERFFEDILGGGDDDEDDDTEDDISPSTGDNEITVNAALPAKPQGAKPANPNVATAIATDEEEVNPTEQLNAAGEIDESGTDTPISESLIETDPIDDEPVPIVQNSVQDPIVVDPVPADEPVNDDTNNDNDDDNDDDDDEDSDESDDDDDDDDEDDDDDDDDDDEDDDDLTAAIEARKSRSAKPAMPKMPAVYVSKYNRFVDAVINRINRILGKHYDPVRVKLLSNLKKSDPKRNVDKKTKKNQKKKGQSRENDKDIKQLNKMGELEIARFKHEIELGITNASSPRVTESESREPAFVLVSRVGSTSESTTTTPMMELRTTARTQSRTTTGNKNKQRNKTKISSKASNKNQVKQSSAQKEKAKATLFGLSSIKRDGDVTVNMMSDYTVVKTNFILGPLTLRVERELARSGKRVLRSATATTAEMFGKMNLKIMPGGTATLSSMKVLQPKQVRIDSSDGHDRTTQFMWKKSPEIASMVSQKLSAATKSMLQPPPQTRP